MKRLRTLSIRDLDALNRRNRRAGWGQWYWRGVNLRKQRESEMRRDAALRALREQLFAQNIAQLQELPLPGELPLEANTCRRNADMTTPCDHVWIANSGDGCAPAFRPNSHMSREPLMHVRCSKCGDRTWFTAEQWAALPKTASH